MDKFTELRDELPELDKRVYVLELLAAEDVTELDESKFNTWIGLLMDSIDLLKQTVHDINTFANAIIKSSIE